MVFSKENYKASFILAILENVGDNFLMCVLLNLTKAFYCQQYLTEVLHKSLIL